MTDLGTIRGQIRLDIRQAVAAYAALRAQNARTVYALRGTGDSFVGAGKTMGAAGGVMVYAFAKVVSAAAEFERKMDYFGAVTDTNAKKMQTLSDYTLQLAQDTIYSAGEIADGIIELGKAGVSAEQIMHGVGDAMASLGAAGDIPLAQSGQIITSTIQQFNMSAKEATHVADLLAGAANASIADISDLGVSLKYVGGVADAAGLKFDDTTTAISLLAKAGIRGSTAGTSLRQMIVSFGGATGPATEQLEELGIITKNGTNLFYDMEGRLKPLSKVFQILQDKTAGLTQKQRLMAFRTIFNNRALSAAAILSREGSKGFEKMSKAMSKISAADVAHKRLDNLSGDIEILKGNIETFMVKAGTPFQEQMRKWVQMLTKLVQAFGNLDPQTQKNIIQFIGMAGAALVVMGAINIVIGTIFRFVASMLKMAAGMKFLFKILRIVIFNLRWLAVILGGAVSATAAIVIAVILALGAAFIIAYKKSETFRNFVNGIGAWLMNNLVKPFVEGAKQIIEWFGKLAKDPQAAWDQLKSGVSDMVSSIGDWFARIPDLISSALDSAVQAIGLFIINATRWFLSLPGKILGIITSFVGKVTSLLTFRNVGYAIGFLIGTMVRLWLQLQIKVISIVLNLVNKVISFFSKLPARIGFLIGFLVGRAIGLFIKLAARLIALAAKIVTGVIRFFAKLPGRVAAFLANMTARGISLMVQLATNLPNLAAQAANGIINFLANLPSRIAGIFSRVVSTGARLMGQFKAKIGEMATGAATALVNGIQGMPAAVSGILDRCIEAIKSVITSAFNAVKDFAAGMWDGFKAGLDINSPSIIERQMMQMTDVIDKETKKISKRTMDVQKLSRKMAQTKFSIGDTVPSAASGYVKLASMHNRNLKRARTLQDSLENRRARDHQVRNQQASSHKLVHGELDISPNGRAFIRGTAQEVYDDNDSFSVTAGRMDY